MKGGEKLNSKSKLPVILFALLGIAGPLFAFFIFPIGANAVLCLGIYAGNQNIYDLGKKAGGLNAPVACSPLHVAADEPNPFFLKDLLRLGLNPNIVNFSEDTPLHVAIIKKRNRNAALLLKAGASVCIVGRNGEMPVNSAVVSENMFVQSVLFQIAPNMRHKDAQGDSIYYLMKHDHKAASIFKKTMRICKKIKCKRACLLKDTHLKDLKIP